MEPTKRPSRLGRLRRAVANLLATSTAEPVVPPLRDYPAAPRQYGR